MDEVVRDFVAEALEGLEALDSKMVRLEQAPDDPALLGEIFRLAHTLKGTSGFLGLGRLQRVAHAAENVLGGFRDGTLTVSPRAVSAILDVIDVIREIVDHLSAHGEEPGGDDSRLITALDAIFAGGEAVAAVEPKSTEKPLLERLGGEATLDAACEAALFSLAGDADLRAAVEAVDPDRLQSALRGGLCDIARATGGDFASVLSAALPGLDAENSERVVAAIRKALADLDAESGAVEQVLAPPTPAATTRTPSASTEASRGAASSADGGQSIRVNVEVLENLMTVVSELVLIRNQLIQTLRLDPESPFAGPLNRLNQVTSELQEGVMTTRMQPISGAWAKLPRLVRDLASDLGKSIELVMHGQETELDRQVLELIKDPLTHMIRNAADHGIETPDRRRAAGKAETGRILLQARHEGGAILVEMSDDGRGLPAEAIRAKALSAGLITSAQAAAMTDAEARQLIFAAGFSTADQVTAVSGRGVGMDVVRTNIEKIGGAIELASVEGQGTRFTIRIPLTLSIVSALIVESNGERFAMPQSSIIELVSAGSGPAMEGAEGEEAGQTRRIEEINGASVLRLRDRLLPLVSLQALLGLDAREDPRADACIVVARIGAFTFGVIVDRVFDTEEIVVKPVASVLRHLKIYSGATIMGDGSVIMILDFKGMSLEAGAGHLVNGAEDALEVGTEASGETQTLLVFRTPEEALKAAPLDSVARIEDLDCATIEHVDGRSVIQYRGALMPVVGCDGKPVRIDDIRVEDGRRRPLLVFARGATGFGVLAEEIIDIVEGPASAQLGGSDGGAAGSVIVAGRATELIDLEFYWRGAGGAPSEPPAPASKVGDRRILVVDQSPFTRLLLSPLLAQAGYGVDVVASPAEALTLHDGGAVFDLILADTTPGAPGARQLAQTLGQASSWHATPLLGLGAYRMDARARMDSLAADLDQDLDQDQLLTDVDDNLMRGAA